MQDLYQEHILDHFKHPRHKYALENPSVRKTGTNSSCGDNIIVYLMLDEQGNITELSWEGAGCAISQASMSVLAEEVLEKKLTPQQISSFSQQNLLELLGLDEISPGREKCLEIGLRTLQKAISTL